jgi:ketosteroid isomerase-like protein
MTPIEQQTRQVVDGFLTDIIATQEGRAQDYLSHMDEDVIFTIAGQTPLSGTYHGVKAVREKFRARAKVVMGRRLGYGLIPTDYIGEGEELVVLARGRGGSLDGFPYNNTYFLYFRVKNGKIVHYTEDFDSSLAWRAIFQCHLG